MLQAKEGWTPQLILASDSLRSKETLEAVMEGIKDTDALFFGSLYTVTSLDGQSREEIERLILEHADDEKHRTILILGHNKGIEEVR